MVDGQKSHGFNELGLNDRPSHSKDGLIGEDRRTLWHSPDITAELKALQIIQKRLIKQALAS
jgi:hypothetical protein